MHWLLSWLKKTLVWNLWYDTLLTVWILYFYKLQGSLHKNKYIFLFFLFTEFVVYNPEIPTVMPFPGPEQCDGSKKMLIVGRIPADMETVRCFSNYYKSTNIEIDA